MARRALQIGRNTLALIEDARIDFAMAALLHREHDTEPAFGIPDEVPDPDDEEAAAILRQTILKRLVELDREELQPLDQRCNRIVALATGKGVRSLSTVIDQQLDEGTAGVFHNQPDPLCRSIWAFLHASPNFANAESFNFARQFRDHKKLYDAFEVELDHTMALDASSIDEAALALKIKAALELKKDVSCTVTALDLPATEPYPASVMLIVRHGGPLSSVHDYRQDGRRGTIYYRPPNETTLIYTPQNRQIEICSDSPVVRQKIADTFAAEALGHNISDKPLTWKRYNLARFRDSLALSPPELLGYVFKHARVIEVEVRLGDWRRKLNLKVTADDDIERVAKTYLGSGNVFRRDELFTRIVIAVVYQRVGDERKRTLNITISGAKSCNLQSLADPDERGLGFTLLKEWGILSAFRQIPDSDLRAIFEQLAKLHDRAENEVGSDYLEELGLDPTRLIEGGLLERKDRQDVILLDDGDLDGEGTVASVTANGMAQIVGPFGEDAGRMPSKDFDRYAVNAAWLHDTLLRLLKPILSRRSLEQIDADLTPLGTMKIDGAEAPVYFARRLNDLKTVQRLDSILRARHSAGVGVVLSASEEMPAHLGPNVVVPLLSHLSSAGSDCAVERDGIELAWRANHALARGGAAPRVVRTGHQSGTLYIPGREPLFLAGNDQITIFERLVDAYLKGSPDVYVGDLMEGFLTKSPKPAFRTEVRDSIFDVYIGRGAKRGYWRLIVAPQASPEPTKALEEETV